MALLDVLDISKTFDHAPVLDRVSFSLEKGAILSLLGPSGCGKTTLLRILAGLEMQDSGSVFFEGRDMSGVEPFRRSFGMMFQEFALFPHKDVYGNVSFGLRMQRLPVREVRRRTREMLSLVGLDNHERRNVGELSGGERQRVALARTLAPRPRLLLLDEPLGALDRALRERLMVELRSILKGLAQTCIFVTHDQAEAYAMADRIAVIIGGRIEQIDAPETLYRNPKNSSVARFLGLHNLIEGTVRADGSIMTEFGALDMTHRSKTGPATLLIQPDAAVIASMDTAGQGHSLTVSGTVRHFLYRGTHYTLELETASGTRMSFDLPDHTPAPGHGSGIRLVIDRQGISILGDGS